jgi:hypothetical protein
MHVCGCGCSCLYIHVYERMYSCRGADAWVLPQMHVNRRTDHISIDVLNILVIKMSVRKLVHCGGRSSRSLNKRYQDINLDSVMAASSLVIPSGSIESPLKGSDGLASSEVSPHHPVVSASCIAQGPRTKAEIIVLPASFYASFLSEVAKARKPSPSKRANRTFA